MPAVKLKTILTFFILLKKNSTYLKYSSYNNVYRLIRMPSSPQSSFYIKSYLKCSSETMNLNLISFTKSTEKSYFLLKSNWNWNEWNSLFRISKNYHFGFQMNFEWKVVICFPSSFDDNNNINATDYVVFPFWNNYHLQLFNVLSVLKERSKTMNDSDKWHSVLLFDMFF